MQKKHWKDYKGKGKVHLSEDHSGPQLGDDDNYDIFDQMNYTMLGVVVVVVVFFTILGIHTL